MDVAKAIRTGGLLVRAEDCDYSSFMGLGLRCPICGGTVFLVNGTERGAHSRKLKSGQVVSVAGASVAPHFSHHSNDLGQIADCEMRSARLTEVQRQAIQSKARGQIAKLFRQKFWRMLKTSLKMIDWQPSIEALDSLWIFAAKGNAAVAKEQLDILVNFAAECFAQSTITSKLDLQRVIQEWADRVTEVPTSIPKSLRPNFNEWLAAVDIGTQATIVAEAIDFVSHKAQRDILQQIARVAIYNWTLAEGSCQFMKLDQSKMSDRIEIHNRLVATGPDQDFDRYTEALIEVTQALFRLDKGDVASVMSFLRDDIVQILAFTDWPKQFDICVDQKNLPK
jgi:hypothetical protein